MKKNFFLFDFIFKINDFFQRENKEILIFSLKFDGTVNHLATLGKINKKKRSKIN